MGEICRGHPEHRRRVEPGTRRAECATRGRSRLEPERAGGRTETKPARTVGGGRSGGARGGIQHAAGCDDVRVGGNHRGPEQPDVGGGVAGVGAGRIHGARDHRQAAVVHAEERGFADVGGLSVDAGGCGPGEPGGGGIPAAVAGHPRTDTQKAVSADVDDAGHRRFGDVDPGSDCVLEKSGSPRCVRAGLR